MVNKMAFVSNLELYLLSSSALCLPPILLDIRTITELGFHILLLHQHLNLHDTVRECLSVSIKVNSASILKNLKLKYGSIKSTEKRNDDTAAQLRKKIPTFTLNKL